MEQLKINFEVVKQYLDLMQKYGVPAVEMRVFNTSNATLVNKVRTDSKGFQQLKSFVKNNNLETQTINCTFNKFPLQHLENDNFLKDSNVEEVKFAFIDIDSVKETKGMSATNQEIESAKKVLKKVSFFLKDNGIHEQIHLFSGNGYHILLPIDSIEVSEAKNLNMQLLRILDEKFSSDTAKIDTSVYNPSRLGKLVGCIASKGTNTVERPHRVSIIMKQPDEVKQIKVDALKRIIEQFDSEKLPDTSVVKKRNKSEGNVKADVEGWLKHYSLDCNKKKGNIDGITIYVLKKCPLKEHSNNQNGASLIVDYYNNVTFKCLHESHSIKDIQDFIAVFPLPDKYNLSIINKEKINDKKEFSFDKFKLNDQGLFVSKDNNRLKICSPIFIEKVYIQEDDNTMSYEICYKTHNKWKSELIKAEMIQANKLKSFISSHGIEMLSRFESDVCDFLIFQKSGITPVIYHQKVGFSRKNERLRYLLSESILESTDDQPKTYLSEDHYYDLSVKGYDKWKEKIESVLGRGPIEYALSIGLVPFLIGFLSHQSIRPIKVPNLVLNFKGKSSTGKTSMTSLIASMYGNLEGLHLTMNATSNALMKLASISNGVAFIADETGAMQASMNLDQLLFSLSSGKERLRLNKDITIKQPENFSTGIIVTSEYSLNTFLSQTPGLAMRYLEFQDVKWTKDAEEADQINKLVINHYGGLIKEISQYVLDNQANVLQLFDDSRLFLDKKIKEDNPFKKRLLNNLALIKTGSHLLELIFGKKVNQAFIDDELTKTYELMIELAGQPTDMVYEKVVEVILVNAYRFVDNSSQFASNKSCIGRVKIANGELVVNIFKMTFEKMLKDIGLTDKKSVLQELLKKNKLHTNPDRNTKRLCVNSKAIATYEIVLPLEIKCYFKIDDDGLSPVNLPNNIHVSNLKQGLSINSDEDLI